MRADTELTGRLSYVRQAVFCYTFGLLGSKAAGEGPRRNRSENAMNCIPVIDVTATGLNISQLRTKAGMTVRDLQNVFGFATPQAIYKWQRGETLPALDNMVVLAAVFGVTVDDILVCEERTRLQVIV